MIGEVELEEVEEYLRVKSAVQVATPVRAELEKLRQASEHPAGLSVAALTTSSPASSSSFHRGMASYRPGTKSVLRLFEDGVPSSPSQPLMSDAKRAKHSNSSGFIEPSANTPAAALLSSPKIPFSPARAKASGLVSNERETCPAKLASRQKQIDYGKNTPGYQRYCALIPRSARKRGDPWTPNKCQVCSKRSWDGQVRKWRRALHKYDPESAEVDTDAEAEVDAMQCSDSNELGECDDGDDEQ